MEKDRPRFVTVAAVGTWNKMNHGLQA